jgi:hypothetical protein
MADEPRSDDLSMVGYPSKNQVEHAIVRLIERGVTPTPTNVADEIGAGCGLRPGDDVTITLVNYYELEFLGRSSWPKKPSGYRPDPRLRT